MRLLPLPIEYKDVVAKAHGGINRQRDRLRDELMREFNGKTIECDAWRDENDVTRFKPDFTTGDGLLLKQALLEKGIQGEYSISALPFGLVIAKRFDKGLNLFRSPRSRARAYAHAFKGDVYIQLNGLYLSSEGKSRPTIKDIRVI